MGDHAWGFLEMLNFRNSAIGHVLALLEKKEKLKEIMTGSNLRRKEYGTVRSSESSEKGLEQLLEAS